MGNPGVSPSEAVWSALRRVPCRFRSPAAYTLSGSPEAQFSVHVTAWDMRDFGREFRSICDRRMNVDRIASVCTHEYPRCVKLRTRSVKSAIRWKLGRVPDCSLTIRSGRSKHWSSAYIVRSGRTRAASGLTQVSHAEPCHGRKSQSLRGEHASGTTVLARPVAGLTSSTDEHTALKVLW